MSRVIIRNRWSPKRIVGVDAYLDARLGMNVVSSAYDLGNSLVSTWTDQVNGTVLYNNFTNAVEAAGFTSPPESIPYGNVPYDDNEPWHPMYDAAAFGSLPGIVVNPDRSLVRSQYLRTPLSRPLPLGLSWLWVSMHTENRASHNHTENCSTTVISECSHATSSGAGFIADQLAYHYVDPRVTGWSDVKFGGAYDDNVPRLFGITHSINGDVKAYVNGAEVDTTTPDTATGANYTTGPAQQAWSGVGTGYAADAGVNLYTGPAGPDKYGGDDGFKGKIGLVVVVNGIISDNDMFLLYHWCRSEGWIS